MSPGQVRGWPLLGMTDHVAGSGPRRASSDQIVAKYPEWLNQGPVWCSALGLLS